MGDLAERLLWTLLRVHLRYIMRKVVYPRPVFQEPHCALPLL